MNELTISQALEIIQSKTGDSLEQIAATIKYSRPHLNREKLAGGSNPAILKALKLHYAQVLSESASLLQNITKRQVPGDDFLKTIEALPLSDQIELLTNRLIFESSQVQYYKGEADYWKKLYFEALNNSKTG